ncbi:MAG: basic secretory protein-like protein [Cellulosilyticaceae bacterium]
MNTKTWEQVTSPEIEYITDDTNGVKLFDELVPNKEDYIYAICKSVAQFLYKTPEEVPHFGKLTLRVERFEGVAWKSGNPPHITVAINSDYLEKYANEGGNITDEVSGVLFHELTHAYQHSSAQELSSIEGVADLVRYLSGNIALELRKTGGEYTSAYKITGFFYDWVRAKYIESFDFLYELNQSASPANNGVWSLDDTFVKLTGETPQALWAMYQEELEAKGLACATSFGK